MNTLFHGVPGFVAALLEASWQATLLVGVVLTVQRILRRCLTPAWRHALWWIVLGRLVLPVTPISSWSLFNLVPSPSFVATLRPVASSDDTARLALTSDDATPRVPTRPTVSDLPRQPSATDILPTKPSAAPHPPRAFVSIGIVATGIWALVAITLLARLAWRNATFSRRVRHSMQPASAVHVSLLDSCRTHMRVWQRIELLHGDLVMSPAIYGLFRPRLLLPSPFLENSTAAQLRHVFLHELAHVRRGDLVVHGLTRVLQALHWFNPLLAWAFRRLRADRELATDALALQVAGEEESRAYGLTLVQWLERGSKHPTPAGTVGILEDHASLERRIRAIASFRQPSRWAPLTAVLLAALVAVSWTNAQPPTAPDPIQVAEAPTVPPPTPPSNDSNRVPVLSDNPGIGRLFRKIPTPDDLPPSLESVRAWLVQASAHQEGGRTSDAAKAYEAALNTASLVGTNAVPEQILAVQGIQATRLSLAKTAWDRNYLNEALAHVARVLAVAPTNPEAVEFKSKILARRALQAGIEKPTSSLLETNSENPSLTNSSQSILEAERVMARLHLGRERARLRALLHSIRVPAVKFDDVPLKEVIRHLKEAAMASNPDGGSIPFVINPILDNPAGGGSRVVDPDTGVASTLPPEDPMTLGDIIIRIDPPMRDVRMSDLLKIITESASAPLAFTIEDYAVVFCHPSRVRPRLVSRVFRIDLERMGPGLENLKRLDTTNSLARGMPPGSLPHVQDGMRLVLTRSGVSLVPPNAVYFNDRQGLLMIRATEGEMKIVETAIQELNAGTRPWPEVAPEADDGSAEVSTTTARERVTGLNSQIRDGPNVPSTPPAPLEIRLVLLSNDQWLLDDRAVTSDQFAEQLSRLATLEGGTNRTLRIEVDPSVPWKRVFEAMSSARAAGFHNVSTAISK